MYGGRNTSSTGSRSVPYSPASVYSDTSTSRSSTSSSRSSVASAARSVAGVFVSCFTPPVDTRSSTKSFADSDEFKPGKLNTNFHFLSNFYYIYVVKRNRVQFHGFYRFWIFMIPTLWELRNIKTIICFCVLFVVFNSKLFMFIVRLNYSIDIFLEQWIIYHGIRGCLSGFKSCLQCTAHSAWAFEMINNLSFKTCVDQVALFIYHT